VVHTESLRFSKKMIIFLFFSPKKNEKEKDLNILFLKETEIERFRYLVKLMPRMDNILVVSCI